MLKLGEIAIIGWGSYLPLTDLGQQIIRQISPEKIFNRALAGIYK